jgi:protein transport protein SEC31
VSKIFAASSSSGYTSVWDVTINKVGKELVTLQYGGGATKGDVGRNNSRGMSDLAWHPEQGTRLVTASEDDDQPVILLWDLRNTRSPERILTGHTKGVLSVSWCKQDADLLVSSGKDNRTIVWNPQTGEIVGELPRTDDWTFQTSWCPSNPNLLATASYDGHIGIHTLQATQPGEEEAAPIAQDLSADDVFGQLASAPAGASSHEKTNIQSLTVAPKWMRRPVSATFGYGGLFASVSNLPGANGKNQSSVVHLRTVVTEDSIMDRAKALAEISGNKDKLSEFSATKSDDAGWKALQTLFKANSRDEIIALLGFDKDDVKRQVQEAIVKYGGNVDDTEEDKVAGGDETPKTDRPSDSASAVSASAVSDSLAAADDRPVTPAVVDDNDFFASMASGGAGALRNPALDSIVPPERADSSVAATAGSGPSSLRSEVIAKDNNFSIYPPGESDVDRLITQALVLGDFKSAVDLCMASDRFADALLLAARGGSELFESTQKTYFARRTMTHPFLRVFQSIVTEDLTDIVQNADLDEWRVVFVVLCTFAKEADFANLADQLGQRLQFKWQLLAASDAPESKENAKTARQDATLCYLAARNLEHIATIWASEMQEEEAAIDAPRYSAHVLALQSFIEKVVAFQAATGYVDKELSTPTAPDAEGARTYPLAGLYDRFHEYADLLATQGLVEVAAKYVQMTPSDYVGTAGALGQSRDRLFAAAGVREQPVSPSTWTAFGNAVASSSRGATKGVRPPAPAASTYSPYGAATSAYGQATSTYGASQYTTAAPTTAASNPYAPAAPAAATSSPYAPAQTSSPYQPAQTSAYAPAQSTYQPANPTNTYQPANPGFNSYASNGYGGGGYQPYSSGPAATIPPPPRASSAASNEPPLVPASQQRGLPGWNDAPPMSAPKRPASAARETPKPVPITSPFPNSLPDPYGAPHGNAPLGAPPRANVLPPPPKGGPRPRSAQQQHQAQAPPPPAPVQSPPQQQAPFNPYAAAPQQHQPPPNAYAPPAHQFQAAPPVPPQGPPRGGPPPPRAAPPRAGPPPPGRAMSPLGPTGARSAQQPLGAYGQQQQQQPPQQQPLAGPPPRAGPPPPGRAGPPPPGRAGPPPPSAQ